MSALISVIIPVYNVEAYIAECLDSVLSQSHRNIEVICVDDCGKDGSLAIAERYAEQDSRVKIIRHEHNRGVGPARNTGLDAASGEYIFFIDPDDIMVEDCLANLLAEAEKSGADVTAGMPVVFCEEEKIHLHERASKVYAGFSSVPRGIFHISKKNIILEFDKYDLYCWGKIFKTSFVLGNNLRFINKNIGKEDEGFSLKILVCNPLICNSEVKVVRYRIRYNSMTPRLSNKTKNKEIEINNKNVILDDFFNYAGVKFHREEYYSIENNIKSIVSYSECFEKKYGLLVILWEKHNKKVSFFGLHLYREKVKKDGAKVYKVLGIPVWKNRHPFA